MKSLSYIFVFLGSLKLLVGAQPCAAQSLTDLVVRSIPTAASGEDSAAAWLERGFYYEKALGDVDSASASYRVVVTLWEEGRADPELARRALDRLGHLGAGVDATRSPISANTAMPGRAVVSEALEGIVARFQLDPWAAPQIPAGDVRFAPSSVRSAHGKRWLRLLEISREAEARSPAPAFITALGEGAAALRKVLGLKGLNHFIEQERRRSGARPLSAHEMLLSALMSEKEQSEFDSALQRYRDVVQLDRPGGIATRLSDRATQGILRCQEWQRGLPAGS